MVSVVAITVASVVFSASTVEVVTPTIIAVVLWLLVLLAAAVAVVTATTHVVSFDVLVVVTSVGVASVTAVV